ncbi:hypothetical protein RF11_15868 [Thelohanellus kitauei]|uniref:Uncharacterized protein n=1 Tax=Thelohanellus kitauei TaxID=669202 RepID=A0A0C2N8P6_THEKT|nr:hypothetical protein RF11_15868 [Thelohanellus kitauei]
MNTDEDKWKILVKYVETLEPYERHYFDQFLILILCNDTNITLFEKLLYLFSGADIEHREQETEMRSSPSDGGKMFPSTGFRVPPPLWRRCEQDSNIYHVLRLAMKNIDLSVISIYSSLTKPPQEMRERSQEMVRDY